MLNLLHQNRLCAIPKPAVTIDSFWDKSSFVASIEDAKLVLIQNRVCNLPYQNLLCACSKTGFVPTLNQPLPNRLCACSETSFVSTLNQALRNRLGACSETGFVPTLNQPLQNRLCACSKTSFVATLNLPHQSRFCIGTKPALSFWINISTVSEVRCDCQGLGLIARIKASILVFDTIQVLNWPVLGQIQFCSFDRRYKTYLDTKPVLFQGRFCSLTIVCWRCSKYIFNTCLQMIARQKYLSFEIWCTLY